MNLMFFLFRMLSEGMFLNILIILILLNISFFREFIHIKCFLIYCRLLEAPSKKLNEKGEHEESKRSKITPKSPERTINKESIDRRLKHLEASAEKRKPSDIQADTEIALKRAKEEMLSQSTEELLEEVAMEVEDVEVTRLVIKVGNHLSPKEQKSEIIIEREKQRTPSPEKTYSPSVKRTPAIVLSSVNNNFQASSYNDTSLPPSPLTPIITPLTPPASPKVRGRDSLHGSSELMLVLLPDSKDQNQTGDIINIIIVILTLNLSKLLNRSHLFYFQFKIIRCRQIEMKSMMMIEKFQFLHPCLFLLPN